MSTRPFFYNDEYLLCTSRKFLTTKSLVLYHTLEGPDLLNILSYSGLHVLTTSPTLDFLYSPVWSDSVVRDLLLYLDFDGPRATQ